MRRPATQAKPASINARPQLPAWRLALLLVLATMVLYWPATRGGLIDYDDHLLVTANHRVQKGLTVEGMKWA